MPLVRRTKGNPRRLYPSRLFRDRRLVLRGVLSKKPGGYEMTFFERLRCLIRRHEIKRFTVSIPPRPPYYLCYTCAFKGGRRNGRI